MGGFFKLSFKGRVTEDIPFDVVDSELKEKLEALDTIWGVTVTKEGLGNGFVWTVTFSGNNSNQPNLIVADKSSLSGTNAELVVNQVTAGTGSAESTFDGVFEISKDFYDYSRSRDYVVYSNGGFPAVDIWGLKSGSVYYMEKLGSGLEGELISEIQTITSTAQNLRVNGTFTLGYGGYFTGNIPYDAEAAVVKYELEALDSVVSVDVTREYGESGATAYGCVWSVTFTGNFRDLTNMVAGKENPIGTDVDVGVQEFRVGVPEDEYEAGRYVAIYGKGIGSEHSLTNLRLNEQCETGYVGASCLACDTDYTISGAGGERDTKCIPKCEVTNATIGGLAFGGGSLGLVFQLEYPPKGRGAEP
ncbi:hypothetical protein TrLO_g7954 [Triparma laevis f. longispina]|nr:hypothetical protein TrLO_g7954 [Triparma laevis f. longispina]